MELTPPSNKFSQIIIKKTTPQSRIFELILLLIIAGLFYWFVVTPKQGALATTETSYQNLQKQQADLTNTQNKLKQALADLQSHPKEVAEMDEALPLDNRVTKLYIALNELTSNSGMTVGNIGIGFNGGQVMAGDKPLLASPYTVTRTVQKLTTTLTATGNFDQFQALLSKLENSGRLINITSVGIQAGPPNNFSFTLNLEAYFYAQ